MRPDSAGGEAVTDLLTTLVETAKKMQDSPALSTGKPVFYCSRRARDLLYFEKSPTGRAIRQRLAEKHRRGPRLRSLVRCPSAARERLRLALEKEPKKIHVATWSLP